MKEKSNTRPKRKSRDRDVLEEIAMLGYGIKDEMRDWGNIGRGAVIRARDQLAGKCKCCGRQKEWKPKVQK